MRSSPLHRATALVLCVLLTSLPVWAESYSAGQISGFTAAASRNSHPLKIKEDVNWNDVLQTDRSGRTRITLRDGSILSLGSESELKMVEHEPSVQQTIVQLNAGRVRSRVVAISRPGGKFEVRTPLATASVVGTDFFVEYVPANNSFRLICYSGVVKVQGAGAYAEHAETVGAGQMITISAGTFGAVQTTPNAVQQDSIAQTTSESGTNLASDSHLIRNVLIGAAVAAAGVVVGLVTTGAAQSAPPQSSSSADKKNK